MPRILTQADVDNFRSRLCDVAAQLFVEQGHEGFNMRELAKRLGVSAMTPYRYFKDKDEILAAVRARAFSRLADALELADDLAARGRAYVQFAMQEQAPYRLMFDISRPQAATFPDLAVQEQRVRAAMAGPGYDGTLEGELLWSALHGVMALYLADKLSPAGFERLLSATLAAHAGLPQTGLAVEPWALMPRNEIALTAAE